VIGLDSNVLVRYLAQDDPRQSARATRLIERELSETNPGYVALVALVETCWVLRRAYRVTAAELHDLVRDLLDVRQLVVEQRAVVGAALAQSDRRTGDFAGALVAACARAAGCARVVTFDRSAAKLGMTLLG
jgi:predicted nucleic-acid-binding protein